MRFEEKVNEDPDEIVLREKSGLIKFEDEETKYIYLEPRPENRPHEFTIIFLHGLGDSA